MNILQYVDDTRPTLSEIIGSNSSVADMQSLVGYIDQLLISSDENNMQINSMKTKMVILGSASNRDWPSLTIHGTPLKRVSVYKLLVVFVSVDLH